MKEIAKKARKLLAGFKNKRILVWGDLILDEYIFTSTGRVSREAPVLVTELESKDYIPGGAGNVVMNIKSLGACPIPVAFSGNDRDGQILREILRAHEVNTDHLIQLNDYDTPKKSRILSGSENTKKQQVLRIDTLNKAAIGQEYYQKIETTLLTLLEAADVLLVSDYLSESVKPTLLEKIKRTYPDKKIIIDSRSKLLEFKGVTISTPNEPEVKKMLPYYNFRGEEDFINAGQELLQATDAAGIILKRGHKGMMVFEKGKSPERIHIHGSPEIVDGTGAGDTVISVVSLALAAGADLLLAARLANVAAGIVVMKEGAFAIPIKELENEFK